jgi:hypothetical protein
MAQTSWLLPSFMRQGAPPPEISPEMLKTVSILGLIIGSAIVLAVVTPAPQTGALEAQASEPSAANCVTQEIPLDEGYGVSRMATRFVCPEN